ncbi:MAG: hypothetical protein R3E95_07435 [Thiolinea sp.]
MLLLLVLPVQADTEHAFTNNGGTENNGVVKLVATLQDNPAFTDVVWRCIVWTCRAFHVAGDGYPQAYGHHYLAAWQVSCGCPVEKHCAQPLV